MRQFFKYVFATVIGLFVFCIVALLGFILILSAALSGREAVIAENSVLKLNLDQQIIEREKDDLFAYLTSPFGQDEAGTNGLLQLTQAIKKAKEDDRIRGILLEVYNPQAGIATLEELRNSLEDFKSSGKFIVAYGENYTEGSYYLASVADKIYLPPSGMLEFNGLDYEMLFIKGTLEKLGLQPEIFKVGSFKSAVEPLTNTEMSEANRLQVQTFLNNI
ncbi:MAG TPA: S49 family peptidase, partial [Cytophagaceae bacterium]